MKPVQISIELRPPDGRLWRYDSSADGPLNEWLIATFAAAGGQELNQLYQNATIRVWELGSA